MRWGLTLALVAGCKSGAQRSTSGSGSGSSVAAVRHITVGPLPSVDGSALLAGETERVPAHQILIDADGTYAVFGTKRGKWSDSGPLLEVDTDSPLSLAELSEVADAAYRRQMKEFRTKRFAELDKAEEAERDRRLADGERPEDIDKDKDKYVPGAMVEPDYDTIGEFRYPEHPIAQLPTKGDGVAVGDETPVRVPKTISIAADKFEPAPFVFTARATTRATLLVDAIVVTKGGMIAIGAPGGVRALRSKFKYVDSKHVYLEETAWAPWIELHLAKDAVEVEAVPGTPVRLTGAVDPAALRGAIASVRAARPSIGADRTIDVLVDDNADMQRLVSVLAVLDAEGATEIGLGKTPGAGALRGKPLSIIPIPAIELDRWRFDAPSIRAAIAERMPAIRACFANEPTAAPVRVHLEVKDGADTGIAKLDGKPTPLGRCVFAQLEAPFARMPHAFKVRFARVD